MGTHSDNDSTTTSARILNKMTDRLTTEEVATHCIPLTNLENDAARLMIADALMLDSDYLTMIAQLIYCMTQGNALFLVELL